MFEFLKEQQPQQKLEQQPVESESRKLARQWLNAQGQRSLYAGFGGLSEAEYSAVKSLVGHAGFGIFYSLLMQMRAESLVALTNTQAQDAAAVAVLQGHVRCLDRVRELLLDISDPLAQQTEEE